MKLYMNVCKAAALSFCLILSLFPTSGMATLEDINFVSPSSVAQQLQQINAPGQTLYASNQNGQFRLLPSTVSLGSPNGMVSYTLSGDIPNLYLISPGGIQFPLQYVLNNGNVNFYIIITGQYIRLPFTGGPPVPRSTQDLQQAP
ncbi:hypothetical protein F5H01DRAFT_353686 [Linnemannia elongata]|nr:hypothetical protein F5H01DRAFT_353686 [Linnemannia elongata]